MRTALSLVALTALFIFVPLASAATFVVPPDEWMIDDASAIVAGIVTDSFPRLTASGDIETVFVLAVDEVLKGTLIAKRVEVVEWGGRIGDRWMWASGAPRYELGKRYLIFMTENRNREWSTQHLTLGRFQFIHSDAGDLLVRDGFEIHGWDIQGNPPVENERFSQGFLSFIRNRVGGLNVQADYFVDLVVRSGVAHPASDTDRRCVSEIVTGIRTPGSGATDRHQHAGHASCRGEWHAYTAVSMVRRREKRHDEADRRRNAADVRLTQDPDGDLVLGTRDARPTAKRH